MTETSLLISTYNALNELDSVLTSAQRLKTLPNEIIIADDGTADQAQLEQLLDKYRELIKVPIIHIYQEDQGNRKSKILNQAIAKTNFPYIIQIDGDIVMNKYFVEDHQAKIEKGVFLFGSRANIKQKYTSEVIEEKKTNFTIFSKEIKKKSRTIRSPFLSQFTNPEKTFSSKFRGCNVSYWRDDAIAINGYNEDFEGWGREDSDFAIRLLNNGIEGRRLKCCALAYHLSHPEQSKANLEKNNAIQEQTISNKTTFITNGIDKYLC